MIKLIAGLGNPGGKYDGTRHNLGFRAVDLLMDRSPARSERLVHNALLFETEKYGLLCKPLSFMNRSGRPLLALAQDLGIEPHQILILYDDFALNLGLIRVRAHGSSGGHNGLESIVDSLASTHVPRVRMGIRTPELESWIDFVLEPFRRSERQVVTEMLDLCCDAVEIILEQGISAAMNRFNKKQKQEDGQTSS
jgi:PTH1 family peptidyl-tRNA hydrolase